MWKIGAENATNLQLGNLQRLSTDGPFQGLDSGSRYMPESWITSEHGLKFTPYLTKS